jgi:hypothetical protein
VAPVDRRVPVAGLPQVSWAPLDAWLAVELPPAAWTADWPAPLELRLVRSAVEREATLLVTDLATWAAYATRAPQVRLERWTFAACEDGRVLIRGTPLPPLAGCRCTEVAGVVVPAGWTWTPAVAAPVVRGLLGLSEEAPTDMGTRTIDLALCLAEERAWEILPAEAFVRATRSAVRLTAEAYHDHR